MDSTVAHPALTTTRFHLLKTLGSRGEVDSSDLLEDVELPHLLHVLLSTVLAQRKGAPICIILPSTEGIAQVLSVLASLEYLANDWEDICRHFIDEQLKPGVRVRTFPQGYVFEVGERSVYAGSDLLALNYIDKKNQEASGRWLIPIREALRYEPTLRKRPIGRARHKLGPPLTTIVDSLADVMTCGNSGLIRNRIAVVGSHAEFERVLKDTHLSAPSTHKTVLPGTLDELFPRGGFDRNGLPIVTHPPGAGGQPLVAISRNLLDLEAASLSKKREPASQIVITDRLDLVLRNLDLTGRIAERQRFVLFAPAGRREELGDLGRQGWTIWEPNPAELLPSQGSVPARIMLPGVDRIHHSAVAELHSRVGWIELESGTLAGARSAVDELGEILAKEAAETDDRLQETLVAIRVLLFRAANWLQFPEGTQIDECLTLLMRLLDEERYLKRYVGDAAGSILNMFVKAIDRYIASHAAGAPTPKGAKILAVAGDTIGTTNSGTVLITGSRASREEADAFLERHGIALRCKLVRELRESRNFPSAIAFSVMRREFFAALVDPWPSKSIDFVGYDFEIDLYRRRLAQRSRVRSSWTLDAERRTLVTGLPASNFRQPEKSAAAPIAPSAGERPLDPKVGAFDRVTGLREWRWSGKINLPKPSAGDIAVDASVVRFIGRSWMAVTEEHGLLALGEGVTARRDSAKDRGSRIQPVEVADLRAGLRLVVREGGDKDIIRLLAEQRVGPEKYARLKQSSSLWRSALRSSGLDGSRIVDELAQVGVRKHTGTIRSWLVNDLRLGPRSDEEVLAIAEAFPLPGKREADWRSCCKAIGELRGLHISAGAQLSDILLERCGGILFEPSDTEIAVDLGIGLVWIIEVGELDERSTSVPASCANRLNWTDTAWRDRLLERPIKAEAA